MRLRAPSDFESLGAEPASQRWEIVNRYHLERGELNAAVPTDDTLDSMVERPAALGAPVEELWLHRLYKACQKAVDDDVDMDAAIDLVLETLDDLLFDRAEERLRSTLAQVDVERVPTEVLLAFLMGTFRARSALREARDGLYQRVEQKLRRVEGPRTDKLLRGLR